MSTHHPFSQHQDPFQQNAPPPRPQRGSRWMVLVAVVIGFGLLLCGGMITLAYLAVQKAAGVRTVVDLPDELPTRADAQQTFNQSLAGFISDPSADPCVDPDVCEFVRTSLALLREGETIPFSRAMFLEAVGSSPAGKGKVGLVERLTINTWLADYEPAPMVDEEYERILNVRLNDAENLATVDLLIYSSESQALSQQWYLVKENDQWKMYDWQRLEYGRRMSDEYAGYVIADTPDAEGYDAAMEELVEAQNLWWDDKRELARVKLRACETKPMLESDRTVGLLRTAYTWMSLDETEDTIRVLKMIPNPDEIWGVWPVLAACYVNEGRYDEAMDAAQRAEKQSPNHPNVHWIYSVIFEEMDRLMESADHAAIALRYCPRDPTVYSAVIENDRPEDIPLLLDCMLLSTERYDWSQVLDHAAGSTAWGEKLTEVIEQRDDMPKGLAVLARANVAWSQDDFDKAAELFLQARGEVELPMLREIASQDHVAARMENDKIVELISEVDDIDDVLSTLVEYAMDDELYADAEMILDALDQADLQDSPWAPGLRGYCNYMLDRYEQALPQFETFYAWLEEQSDDGNEETPGWMLHSVAYYLTDSWIELGQPMNVIDRWPDEVDRLQQLGTALLLPSRDDLRDQVLEATKETDSDSIRVQRLRMMARNARLQGDADACDQFHREAIELGDVVFGEDDSYQLMTLISERATDLVWNRIADPTPVAHRNDPENDFRDQLFIDAVREAVLLMDEQLTGDLIGAAKRNGIDEGASFASLQQSLGELMVAQGNHAAAANAFLASYEAESDATSWRQDQRRRGYISASLRAGQTAQVEKWLATNEETSVWDRALLAISSGQGSEVVSILSDATEPDVIRTDVISWLSRGEQREWMEQYADQDWVDELLRRYPISTGFRYHEASGQLIFAADAMPDSARMEEMVRDAVGSNATIQELELAGDDDTARGWVVTTEDDQRMIFGFALIQYDASNAPASIGDALSKPALRMAIEVIDRKPEPIRRLFEAVTRVASDRAIAFEWNDGPMLWTGEKLADRLQWKGRVPVEVDTHQSALMEENRDDPYVDGPSVQQWADELAQTEGGSIPVRLRLSATTLMESIPAQLVEVDVANYDLHLRVESASQLDPLVQPGRRFTSGVGIVERR